MTRADWCACGAAIVAPLVLALCTIADDTSLAWTVDPLRWPELHVIPLLSFAALLAPLVRRPVADDAEMSAPVRPALRRREVAA